MNVPEVEERPIAVRAYCVPQKRKDDEKRRERNKKEGPLGAPLICP